jgi:hypothetical protein
MRTSVYVDGFNLYYRLLKENPALKWLDLKALSVVLLQPQNQVQAVHYYTARVSGRFDPQAPARQQIYLDALKTVPEIAIHSVTSSFRNIGPGLYTHRRCEVAACHSFYLLILKWSRCGRAKRRGAM